MAVVLTLLAETAIILEIYLRVELHSIAPGTGTAQVHTASNLSAAQMIHGGGWIGEGEGYERKGYDRVYEQTLNRTAYRTT